MRLVVGVVCAKGQSKAPWRFQTVTCAVSSQPNCKGLAPTFHFGPRFQITIEPSRRHSVRY